MLSGVSDKITAAPIGARVHNLAQELTISLQWEWRGVSLTNSTPTVAQVSHLTERLPSNGWMAPYPKRNPSTTSVIEGLGSELNSAPEMMLWVDSETQLPLKIKMQDPDPKNKTIVVFDNFEWNVDIR